MFGRQEARRRRMTTTSPSKPSSMSRSTGRRRRRNMQTPAKELPANAVIDAEIGALLAAVAQPAAQGAGEAGSGGRSR